MLSPDTTEGAFLWSAKPLTCTPSNSCPPNREASAVKGVVTPAMTRIVANKRSIAAVVTLELFFLVLLRLLCFILLPSTDAIYKRLSLLIGQVTYKNI